MTSIVTGGSLLQFLDFRLSPLGRIFAAETPAYSDATRERCAAVATGRNECSDHLRIKLVRAPLARLPSSFRGGSGTVVWLFLVAAAGGRRRCVVVGGGSWLLAVAGCSWVLGVGWLLVAVGWSTSIILRNTNIYYFKTAYGVIYRRKTRSSVVPGKDRVRSKELWSTRKEAHPCSVPFQTSTKRRDERYERGTASSRYLYPMHSRY